LDKKNGKSSKLEKFLEISSIAAIPVLIDKKDISSKKDA
jgi:hypothetical protein